MKGQEKVRLLVVDSSPSRSETISIGAASVISKWPEHVASAVWFALFFISIVLVLVLLIFILLSRYEGRRIPREMFLSQYQSRAVSSGVRNALSSSYHHAGIGDELGVRDLNILPMFNSVNNIFMFRIGNLDTDSSCSLESILAASKGRTVFLIIIGADSIDGEYEKKLRSEFSNVVMVKVNGKNYLSGSLFQGFWNGKTQGMIAAKILTIWHFGGKVVSDDIIMTDDKWPSYPPETCSISTDVVSSPVQCSAFIYELMLNAQKYKPKSDQDFQFIINQSLSSYCGHQETCTGVELVSGICDKPSDGCSFVRIKKWREIDPELSEMVKYCPITYKFSRNFNSSFII